MSRKIVTANRLADGAVVYLDPLGRWIEQADDAALAADGAALTALLRLAETTELGSPVVGAYAIAIEAAQAGRRRGPATMEGGLHQLGGVGS